MNQDILRRRTKRFLYELQIPVTKFAAKIGFSRELYYRWQKEDFNFSAEKAQKINEYLKQYGF